MTVSFPVGVLKELSVDERTRMIAEDREIARIDEVSRLNGARKEGEQKILDLLRSGKTPEEILREYGAD